LSATVGCRTQFLGIISEIFYYSFYNQNDWNLYMNRLKKQLFSSVFGLFLIAYAGICSAFIVDTNSASGSLSGIWSNPNEGGWGVSVTHQYGKMFVALYVYDNSGAPVWYSASDCSVAASGCTGSLYKVTGGTAPTAPWSATNLVLGSVGSIDLKFSDVNTGSLAFTINGASAAKNIARYCLLARPLPLAEAHSPSPNYSTAQIPIVVPANNFGPVLVELSWELKLPRRIRAQ
jgi:hypothetical protein